MRRQQQSAGGFVPQQVTLLPIMEGGSQGQATAYTDPIDPDTRRAMAALSHPGAGGSSALANPGAPNVGSVTANPGMPSLGSAVPGLGDMFASAMAAAQQRASALMQSQPRIFGGSTDSQAAPSNARG